MSPEILIEHPNTLQLAEATEGERNEKGRASGGPTLLERLTRNLGPIGSISPAELLSWVVLGTVIIWAYASPIWGLAVRWWKEADYGHGFFVPVFAVVLLCLRWNDWAKRSFPISVSSLAVGLGFLVVAWLCRYIGHASYLRLLEPASIIPALAGVALLIGGWNALGWAWPAIIFLIFMIPLPGAIADALRHPLQRISTIASTYILQVVGIPAISRGNIIVLPQGELGVVEACSGLRMMVLFFAVCVGAAFVVRRPLLDRVLVVLSAPVIAVASNVFRISITGVLHEVATPQLADFVFHDLAGWLMAPVALAILWGELWWLERAFVVVEDQAPMLPLSGRARVAGAGENRSLQTNSPVGAGKGSIRKARRRRKG
jgi:exosortase